MTDNAIKKIEGAADWLEKAADTFVQLATDLNTQAARLHLRIEELETERDQLKARVTELEEIEADELHGARETLTDVRYWFHSIGMRGTWPLLRKVEDCLRGDE